MYCTRIFRGSYLALAVLSALAGVNADCQVDGCYRALFPCESPQDVAHALGFCSALPGRYMYRTDYPAQATSACGDYNITRYLSACACGSPCSSYTAVPIGNRTTTGFITSITSRKSSDMSGWNITTSCTSSGSPTIVEHAPTGNVSTVKTLSSFSSYDSQSTLPPANRSSDWSHSFTHLKTPTTIWDPLTRSVQSWNSTISTATISVSTGETPCTNSSSFSTITPVPFSSSSSGYWRNLTTAVDTGLLTSSSAVLTSTKTGVSYTDTPSTTSSTASTSSSHAACTPFNQENIGIENGDFENGLSPWYFESPEPRAEQYGPVSPDGAEGSCTSFRVQLFRTLASDSEKVNFALFSPLYDVEVGRPYQLSFWVKFAARNAAQVSVQANNFDTGVASAVAWQFDEASWAKVTTSYTPSVGWVELVFQYLLMGAQENTVWIDRVQLTPMQIVVTSSVQGQGGGSSITISPLAVTTNFTLSGLDSTPSESPTTTRSTLIAATISDIL
ncbi:hypothetical protein BX600DRAFT_498902 [Xylariales sp. PMI_506]|nr:hypothetical protein BX600DRAFT_498902 [Xylariales sp. PMI_506]